MATNERIFEAVVWLGEIYGKTVSPAVIELWTEAFAYTPNDTFGRAVKTVAKKSRFFPSVSEVLELTGELNTPESAIEWIVAWLDKKVTKDEMPEAVQKLADHLGGMQMLRSAEYRDWTITARQAFSSIQNKVMMDQETELPRLESGE